MSVCLSGFLSSCFSQAATTLPHSLRVYVRARLCLCGSVCACGFVSVWVFSLYVRVDSCVCVGLHVHVDLCVFVGMCLCVNAYVIMYM